MQSAFLIPLNPPGQFSAMLALSFQGNAYVNMLDKILSAIKQLMCLKFTVVVYSLLNIGIFMPLRTSQRLNKEGKKKTFYAYVPENL